MDLKLIQIIALLSCVSLSFCEVSQQKLTGDESSLSSDTQVTESTLASSAGLSRLSSSSSSSTTSSPSPYSFSYNTADVAGTQLVRQEAGDANGAVRGRYGYRDADGLYRTVEYIADANGFRAAIRSNEPGLGNTAEVNGIPASVLLQTEATPTKVASKVASASSLARKRVSQNILANAVPTTTSTTRRPVTASVPSTTTTVARPSLLDSLTPVNFATKGGVVTPIRIAAGRVTPGAAARANSVRQGVRQSPSTLRLVSSRVASLPRLAPTTTTTTTEAPTSVSQQFLSGQQEDQQVRSSDDEQTRSSNDQQIKSTDEQIQSDSLGTTINNDQQKQTSQQQEQQSQPQQQLQQKPQQQPQQQPQPQQEQQLTTDDQQDQQVKTAQPIEPVEAIQTAQPVQQTVQQKQTQVDTTEITEPQTDSSPIQSGVTFTDVEEAVESLPGQPQVQTHQPQPQIQTIPASYSHQHQHQHQHHGQIAHENPLLVRFLDEDLTYDSIEYPHIQAQPRTIAIQTDDHPLSRLYRIVPIPHHESLRLHQAGANMMYLTSAQSY